MSLFEQDDYKKWVNETLGALPGKGRGQSTRIAEHLGVSPTIVTQVFRGDRDLTPEQALRLAEYFGLSHIQTRYLVQLVNLARAGSHRYQQLIREELAILREQGRQIGSHVQKSKELGEEAKAVLYSNWYYLAAWSLVAMGLTSPQEIAKRLGIRPKKAAEALDFLLTHGLLVQELGEKMKVGPTLVHLEADSPQISRHHQNWRLRAFTKYDHPASGDAFYTAPVTLSAEDAAAIRERLLQFIAETVKRIGPSPSEKLYCLCLDWFEV